MSSIPSLTFKCDVAIKPIQKFNAKMIKTVYIRFSSSFINSCHHKNPITTISNLKNNSCKENF